MSEADEETILAHLREVFVKQDEDGQDYFLRFYDPRVLRVLLPANDAEQTARFFGPIRRFCCEDQDGAACLLFQPGDSGVRTQTLPL